MDIDLGQWLKATDKHLKEMYSIDHRDAGWSEADIDRFYGYGMEPEAFVRWYGEKYELLDFCGDA